MTSKPNPNSLMSRIVAACSGERGATMREIRDVTQGHDKSVGAMTPQLVVLGRLFRAGPKMLQRYFATVEARDAWAIVQWPEREAELKRQRDAKNALRREVRRLQSKARYADQRAKIGETVKPRKPTGNPHDVSTTPKKAAQGEPGRGRGIVIGNPRAYTVVTAQDRAKPTTKHSGEPIIPAHVKVQVCPSGRDTRFLVDPSIAGRGAITEMWLERMNNEGASVARTGREAQECGGWVGGPSGLGADACAERLADGRNRPAALTK